VYLSEREHLCRVEHYLVGSRRAMDEYSGGGGVGDDDDDDNGVSLLFRSTVFQRHREQLYIAFCI
jgi:hypothetical protein